MSTDTLTQDILDARRNLPRFIPDDLLIITNTNAARDLAEHLTTRGWRQQTTITELSDVEELPTGSVVRDSRGTVRENLGYTEEDWWHRTGSDISDYATEMAFPVRVLYIPEEQ